MKKFKSVVFFSEIVMLVRAGQCTAEAKLFQIERLLKGNNSDKEITYDLVHVLICRYCLADHICYLKVFLSFY